jgi:hypothetical protein
MMPPEEQEMFKTNIDISDISLARRYTVAIVIAAIMHDNGSPLSQRFLDFTIFGAPRSPRTDAHAASLNGASIPAVREKLRTAFYYSS